MAISRLIEDKYLKSVGKTTSYLEDIGHNTGIYKWTNKINGKIYIGRAVKLRKRYLIFNNMLLDYAGKYINNARKKYNNSDYWDYEIIEYCIKNNNILNNKEKYWIEYYKTNNSEFGYNLTKGGDGVIGYLHTEASKEKISKGNKGKRLGKPNGRKGIPMNEETKIKLSKSKKGKTAHNKGIPMSEEQRRKMYKPVIQFSLEGEYVKEWESAQKANEYYKLSYGTISAACRGKQKTAFGFKWKYK